MFGLFSPPEIPDHVVTVGDLRRYLDRFDESTIILERRIGPGTTSFGIRNFQPEVYSYVGRNTWEKGQLGRKNSRIALLLT